MTIEEAREKLGSEFDSLSDDQVKNLLDIIVSFCDRVILGDL